MADLPPPMTPADCDLRGLPFMPVDLVRLFDSDIYALSNGEEFKAAFTLWGKAFLQIPAGSLPDDDRVLAHLSGTGARWKKLKTLALHGFVKCSDGRLYHPVVCEKAREAWSHRIKQRERAAKRWQGHGNAAADATGHAAASPAAMQGTGTVKGQIREKEEERVEPASPAAPPQSRQTDLAIPEFLRREASRLTIEALPDDWRAFCAADRPDLDPDRTFALFHDHWIAKPGKDGRKLDWMAAWRNWVRRERSATGSLFPAKPPDPNIPQRWLDEAAKCE